MRPGRQVVQPDLVLGQPLGVRVLARPASALISSSSTIRPCGGVDQEHPAGLEPALADDGGRVEVEHADLAGQHDQAVVGHPVAGRAQAVAVEHGADHGAVGEGDRGRAVPRLHQRARGTGRRPGGPGPSSAWFSQASGIIISTAWGSERPPRWSSSSDLVERGRVARPGGADREDPRRGRPGSGRCASSASRARIQLRLPGQRVDLAVVGDVPVRVGQRPAREGVGREPGVDEREPAVDALVGRGRGRTARSWSDVSMPL